MLASNNWYILRQLIGKAFPHVYVSYYFLDNSEELTVMILDDPDDYEGPSLIVRHNDLWINIMSCINKLIM